MTLMEYLIPFIHLLEILYNPNVFYGDLEENVGGFFSEHSV